MKCGHCQHFDHATYPKMGTLGMGFCKIGALPNNAGTTDIAGAKVFRHWSKDIDCGRGTIMPEAQRPERRAWIAELG